MDIYIYGLLEEGTDEIRYVGRTAKLPKERLAQHIWKARTASEWYVSRWIRSCEYRVVVTVLERNPVDPREAERRWIDELGSSGRLTNLTPGGDGAPPRGFLLSPEQRAKISESNRRRVVTEESRKRRREAATGHKHSDASKAKMSAARKGVPKSPETRAKMSAAQRKRYENGGPPLSAEHRAKLSLALKGRPKSPEHRAKILEARRRRPPISEETRARMSAAQKRRFAASR